MIATVKDVMEVISKLKLNLTVESVAQIQIEVALLRKGFSFTRHIEFDDKNIPDFFDQETGITIEVKLKGQKMAIYRQCARYCKFDQVKEIILVSNRAMKIPKTILGKPAHFFHIGKAWL